MRRTVTWPGTRPVGATIDVRRPLPAVLVISPSGVLDEGTAARLTEYVDDLTVDVLHVVVDVRAVAPVSREGARTLLDLDRRTTRRGAVLHVAGIDGHALLRRLVGAGLLRGARTAPTDPLPPGAA